MSACSDQKIEQLQVLKVERPAANFIPCVWGDYLHDYSPDDKETRERKAKDVGELEQKVRKEYLMSVLPSENPAELLSFIDNVERLGVAYRFADEIEEALLAIFRSFSTTLHKLVNHHGQDLHLTSLCFRLLRQHGYHVSCEIFESFKDSEKGGFKESLASDIQGMLSLYEASHLRVHAEYILDEALEFTSFHLKSLDVGELIPPLSSLVTRALNIPLHKATDRLEARHYITIYEQDPSHNKTLLKFAKLDFNLIQSLYKAELRDLSRWWKDLDMCSKLPFLIRDRVMEGYFWTLGTLYEPQYHLGRRMFFYMFKLLSILDDVYDAHGTVQELELLFSATERWDTSPPNELPESMKLIYQMIQDIYKGFEDLLAEEGRSHLVHYAIQELIAMSRCYLQEARWRHDKYTPTYEEYMNDAAIISFGNSLAMCTIFLGVGEIATEDAFKWIRDNSSIVIGGGKLGRLMNDMVSREFERERDHVQSAVECYMRQHGATREQAHKEFQLQLDDIWKDINQAMLRPMKEPRFWLHRQLSFNRIVHLVYKDEDTYTFPESTMEDNILSVLINPIPM